LSEILNGKVALVTGGSSGIGRATAVAFGREGAKVVVASRRIPEGEETVDMIRAAGGDALFVRTDVTHASEVEAMVGQTVETYGRLDFAFNNAGTTPPMAFTADCPEELWDHIINTNLKGIWLSMKHELPQMLKQGAGVIVNNSSVAGLVGFPGRAAYAASKHAIIGLTKTAALEYARAGIRVNVVCPGWIRTPMLDSGLRQNPQFEAQILKMQPNGRIGTPEEVAGAVIWLCSDTASFVTGHTLVMDGGLLAQ